MCTRITFMALHVHHVYTSASSSMCMGSYQGIRRSHGLHHAHQLTLHVSLELILTPLSTGPALHGWTTPCGPRESSLALV